LDYEERKRKKEAREPRVRAATAKKLRGLKAKIYNKKRFSEKVKFFIPNGAVRELGAAPFSQLNISLTA
jgi:hypothetical protein